MWPVRNSGYILPVGYIQIRRERRIYLSRQIYPDPADIILPPDIRARNLYVPPFRLLSCHVRPISSFHQISGFPPDASRLVFSPIMIVPRQIFSRQIRLALRRRAHNVHAPPFLIKVPPCILGPTHSCDDMMARELVMSPPLSVVLPLQIVSSWGLVAMPW